MRLDPRAFVKVNAPHTLSGKEVIPMPGSLLVGIDVSSGDNRVRLLDSSGNSISKFSVPNNQPGAKTLVSKIVSAMTSNRFDSLVIGLEATSVYGEPLVLFLKQDADISPFRPRIHVLNPKQVNAFKKAFLDLPKTDDVDAWIIAENLRFGRINQEVYMDDSAKFADHICFLAVPYSSSSLKYGQLSFDLCKYLAYSSSSRSTVHT